MSLSIVYGRLNYSLTTSRYTTPILMGYGATLVFWAPAMVRAWKKKQPRRSIVLLLIPLFLLTTQTATYMKPVEPFDSHNSPSSNVNFRHMQKVALLANILQIRDTDLENSHFTGTILGIKDHYPLFNIEPFNDAIKTFGTIDTSTASTQCIGNLETIETITSDSNSAFMRMSGWIFNPSKNKIPKALRIEDGNHHVIGYAIAGGDRPDVSLAYHKSNVKKSGYNGYILKEYAQKHLIAHSVFPDCTMVLRSR